MQTPGKLLTVAILGLAFAAAAGSARAQSKTPAPAPPSPAPGGDVMYFAGPGPEELPLPEMIEFIGVEGPVGGKVVTGAPFSASFSSETVQTLADGNRIDRKTAGTLARDAQGRTRRDMTMPAIGAWSASGAPKQISMINDPVAGTHYVLEPDKKIARQLGPHDRHSKQGNHGPAAGRPAWKGAADANVTTTSLGTQTINGVSAEGTRTTRTIPAGAIGNQLPIVITVERWYSTELQTEVMTKRSDPRMGETVMQLTNIVRQTPDASLFQVPAGYTIKQGGPKGTFRRELPPQ